MQADAAAPASASGARTRSATARRAGMVRRCLARLDEDGSPARCASLRALSDTHPVGTQGPVWYVGGKAV